jgi:hypothetical protein
LNIDAGDGDIFLSTNGAITIEGPGHVLAKNISLNLANRVEFSGGTNGATAQSKDLLIKAKENITIDADHFVMRGGHTTGQDGLRTEKNDPLNGTGLTNDSILEAGKILKITTTSDGVTAGSGDLELIGGTADFAALAQNSSAEANAFIKAETLELDIGGDLILTAGNVSHTGAGTNVTGDANAIIQATNGKDLKVAGSMRLTGGTMDVGGTDSTAIAVFDPISALKVEVGKNLILEGGEGPANSLVYASILNSGEILLDVGQAFAPGLAGTISIGTQTYKEGIILIGGAGSGRFDFNNNALSQNGYPISWTLYNGAEFTVDTGALASAPSLFRGDAFIQSLAPRGVDSGLYSYLLFAIEQESTGRSERAANDQSNFTRTGVGSCN